jgi:hypothetical protein
MPWEAMSNSNSNQFVTDFQAIHDQQIVRSFINPSSQPFLQVGSVVLRLIGFGVVIVVGFNPAETQVRDIAIKITHNGCVSRVRVWVRAHDGASG